MHVYPQIDKLSRYLINRCKFIFIGVGNVELWVPMCMSEAKKKKVRTGARTQACD